MGRSLAKMTAIENVSIHSSADTRYLDVSDDLKKLAPALWGVVYGGFSYFQD